MKITSVTVEYGLTENLGEYNNVRHSVRLTAELEEGDDVADVEASLILQAQVAVHETVNEALEAHGRPAFYHDGARYDVLRQGGLVFLLPSRRELGLEVDNWLRWRPGDNGHRLVHAKRLAAQMAAERGERLVDCTDGDFTPVIETYREYEKERAEREAARERARQEQLAAFRDGERGRHPFDDDDYEPEEDDEDF
jgi:hypothetical protein